MRFLLQEDAAEMAKNLIVPDSVQKAQLANTIDKLINMDYNQLVTNIVQEAGWILLKVVLALVIYAIGKAVINWIVRIMDRACERREVDISLRSFLRSLVKVLLMILVLLVVVQTLGINTTSFIAIFASAGLAVGMALSGTLQNFAGGIILLILRPYRVGDFISAQGQSGIVAAIGLFQTRIQTTDNRIIYVPNGSISSSIIDNYSQEQTRRIEWTVSVSYGDNVDVAREAVMKILASDARVLKAPQAPDAVVYLGALADSSVNLTIRAWVKGGDYWDVFFAMNERFYKELPQHGINFPFPQMDVHITKE